VYTAQIAGASDLAVLALRGVTKWTLESHTAIEASLFVDAPRASFVHGRRHVSIRIDDDAGFERIITATLMGPEGEQR